MINFPPNTSTMQIVNGTIENISFDNNNTLLTVTYRERPRQQQQTVRLVVSDNTVILDERGNTLRARNLRTGMTINATISSAMTRSIPPQANAFVIQIVRRPMRDNITVGRIVNVDRQSRTFTTIRDGNLSSLIRFNVPEDARIFDRLGRQTNFARLVPGTPVRVRHAAFMTASIPPQTTAFEVRIL